MIKTTQAKLLTVKVAAVAIGVTALGGVALANGTGAPDQRAAKAPQTQSAPPRAATAQTEGAGGRKSPKVTPSPKVKEAKGDKRKAVGTPAPSMIGMCRAYAAKPAGHRGKAVRSPAFTALRTAAGGPQNVTAYCTAVLAAKASGVPTSHPNGTRDKAKQGKPVPPGHQRAAATPAPRFTAN